MSRKHRRFSPRFTSVCIVYPGNRGRKIFPFPKLNPKRWLTQWRVKFNCRDQSIALLRSPPNSSANWIWRRGNRRQKGETGGREGIGQQIELAVSSVIYRHRAILRARHVLLKWVPRYSAAGLRSCGETRRGIGEDIVHVTRASCFLAQ